jgi:hypothetical protein
LFARFSKSCSGFQASQIAFLTPQTCNGFKSTQFNNLSHGAVSTFSASQVAMLALDVCRGLTTVQLADLSPQAFAGMTVQCASNVLSDAWEVVSASQISSMQAETALVFGPILGHIPPSAVGGFTTEQFALLSQRGYCSFFNTEQFSSLSVAVFASMSRDCVCISPRDAWAQVSAEKLSKLSPTAFSGLRPWQLQSMPAASLSKISVEQVAAFSSDVCAAITAEQFAAVPSASFFGFNKSCIHSTKVDIWPAISAAQLAAMNPATMAGLRAHKWSKIPAESMSGLSREQIANLDGDRQEGQRSVCEGFTASQISHVPPMSFRGFKKECLGNVLGESWSDMRADQLREVPNEAWEGVGNVAISYLPGNTIKDGFTATSFSHLNGMACAGFTPEQVELIPATTLAQLSAACFSGFAATALQAIAPSQIQAIPTSAFVGLRYYSVGSFNDDAFRATSWAQFSVLQAEAVSGILPNQWTILMIHYGQQVVNLFNITQMSIPRFATVQQTKNNIPTNVFFGEFNLNQAQEATWLTLAAQKRPSVGGYTAEAMSRLPPAALAGLQSATVSSLSDEVLAGFSGRSGAFFLADCAAALSYEQFSKLPLSFVGNFSTYIDRGQYSEYGAWSGVSTNIIRALSFDYIKLIVPRAFDVMQCAQLRSFTDRQERWINENADQAIRFRTARIFFPRLLGSNFFHCALR